MCRYAQFYAFISVIELPRIPAYRPKKVANIFKKIISDKNTPEIVQNFYDHQVLLGYKNSRTMCVLHDTAVNNSHTLRID